MQGGLSVGADAVMTSGYILDVTGATRGTTFINYGGTTAASATGDGAFGSTGTYFFLDESADQIDFVADGAGALGPVLRTYHNSASPAVDDVLGRWLGDGRDANGQVVSYGRLDLVVSNTGVGTHAARWEMLVAVASTLTERFAVYPTECRAIAGLVAGSDAAITSGYVLDVIGDVRVYNSGVATILFQSDTAGAAGPTWRTYHNSASPAPADAVYTAQHDGEDDAGNTEIYGEYRVIIDNPANTLETSHWDFDVRNLGATNTATLSALGAWTNASSAAGKTYVPWPWIQGSALATIRALNTGVYHGRGNAKGDHHVGPTAECWRDVTGLPGTRRGLAGSDTAGLALLGIAELHDRLEAIEKELTRRAS